MIPGIILMVIYCAVVIWDTKRRMASAPPPDAKKEGAGKGQGAASNQKPPAPRPAKPREPAAAAPPVKPAPPPASPAQASQPDAKAPEKPKPAPKKPDGPPGTLPYSLLLEYGTFSHAEVVYDPRLKVFQYRFTEYNSHGTTETLLESPRVAPRDLIAFLHRRDKMQWQVAAADETLRAIVAYCAAYYSQAAADLKRLKLSGPARWGGFVVKHLVDTQPDRQAYLVEMPFRRLACPLRFRGRRYRGGIPHQGLSKRARALLPVKIALRYQENCIQRAVLTLQDFREPQAARERREFFEFLTAQGRDLAFLPLLAWQELPAAEAGAARLAALMPAVVEIRDRERANAHDTGTWHREWYPEESLTPAAALEAGRGLAEALARCHRAGFVLRDVAVHTLCVRGDGRYCLRSIDGAREAAGLPGVMEGTLPRYLPPEALEGRPFDYGMDVFALARCLVVLLWGWDAVGNQEGLVPSGVDFSGLPRLVSDQFLAALSRACAPLPSERYRDGGEFYEALMAVDVPEAPAAPALVSNIPVELSWRVPPDGMWDFDLTLERLTLGYSAIYYHAPLAIFAYLKYLNKGPGSRSDLYTRRLVAPGGLQALLNGAEMEVAAQRVPLFRLAARYRDLTAQARRGLRFLRREAPHAWGGFLLRLPWHMTQASQVFLLERPLNGRPGRLPGRYRGTLPRLGAKQSARARFARQWLDSAAFLPGQAMMKLCQLPSKTGAEDQRAVCGFLSGQAETSGLMPLLDWRFLPELPGRAPILALLLPRLETLRTDTRPGFGDKDRGWQGFNYRRFEAGPDGGLHLVSGAVEKLPPHVVLAQGRFLARALSICHENGIIHRDVTPDNLYYMAGSDALCLGDFGIAGPRPKRFGQPARGTPGYVAPEVLWGLPYDCSVDVFALARCLMLMLAGEKAPFSQRAFRYRDLDESDWISGISPAFFEVLKRATLTDPAARYRDGGEFLRALLAVDRADYDDSEARTVAAPAAGGPALQSMVERLLAESRPQDKRLAAPTPAKRVASTLLPRNPYVEGADFHLLLNQAGYSHEELYYHASLKTFAFLRIRYNGHGTSEIVDERHLVPPDKLAGHLDDAAMALVAQRFSLDALIAQYKASTRPARRGLRFLRRENPAVWGGYRLRVPLSKSQTSAVYLLERPYARPARRRPAVYRRGKGQAAPNGAAPRAARRKKPYDQSPRYTFQAVMKVCHFESLEALERQLAVCAFLTAHRGEDSLMPLLDWRVLPAKPGQAPALAMLTQQMYKLAADTRIGFSDDTYGWPAFNDPGLHRSNLGHLYVINGRADTLPPEAVLQHGRRLAKALALCHESGIIHRDVTPDNLYYNLSSEGLCLGGFDYAGPLPERFDQPRGGGPYNQPPEMLRGLPYDCSVDVFGLARCLMMMLWGRRLPFWKEKLWFGQLDRNRLHPGISDGFYQVLEKAAATEPRARYRDGKAFLEALMAVDSAT